MAQVRMKRGETNSDVSDLTLDSSLVVVSLTEAAIVKEET